MSKKPDSDKMESFKDPFYKKMWFWMLIGSALFIIMVIGSISANNNAISSAQKSDTSSNSHSPSGDSEKSEIEQRASIAEEKRLKSLERAETERVAKEAEEKAQAEKAAKEAAEKAAQEAAAKAAAEKAAQEAADRDPNSYQALPYEEMARNGNNHKGEKLQITGTVIQVTDSAEGGATLRVATNGKYDDVYMVQISKNEWQSHRLLKDDVITFYGYVYGLYSYKSVMGGQITVPALIVKFY